MRGELSPLSLNNMRVLKEIKISSRAFPRLVDSAVNEEEGEEENDKDKS
jgi:hypothetical protein